MHANPSEMTLRAHSTAKMNVQSRSVAARKCARPESGSLRGESIARQIDETTITPMMNVSVLSSKTALRAHARTGWSGAK